MSLSQTVSSSCVFFFFFRRRNNSNVLREELIQDLASDIKMRNALHRADMKTPDLCVIVEVIRNICCMAVVPKYFHYRKYNLLEVAKINAPASQKDQEQGLKSNLVDKNVSDCESKTNVLETLTDPPVDLGGEGSHVEELLSMSDQSSTVDNSALPIGELQ